MGELFLAAAGETGGFEKLCVVKKVLHSLQDAGVRRRFLDEAKVVVRLNHANLVQVFDAGRVGPDHYLAMELVEGKDLRALWNRCAQLHRRIPVDVAIFVIRELARGLDYVHNAMNLDLVHRDISPPNILVGYHGEVKVTDFGLAKSAIKREMTSPGVVFGRYSYLSPEQARGLPADRRTDIYAAGIVLWELLTGRQLFPSSNRTHQEALAAVRNPKVVPPSSVVPGVPPGLDEVVIRALAKEREERYPTAGEFRAGLSNVLSSHFPSCNADRISEFMREIFAYESKAEADDYAAFAREDFSQIREQGSADAISISDVIWLEDDGQGETTRRTRAPKRPPPTTKVPVESSTITLGDSDIVEVEEHGPDPHDDELLEEAATSGPWPPPDMDNSTARRAASRWVGRVVAKRYRIDGLVGIGGMGAVFRATHLALGKTFALKVLHPTYTRDADLVARFMREARAATQTGHPNIIDVVDVGTTDGGGVYSVMELLEGHTLSEAIERDGPLAVRRSVHVARQICRALGAAHAAGIIHRDLKSENIYLIARGRDPDFVKVLDFGICKQLGAENTNQTSPGLVLGSPGYMAPEQGSIGETSVATDIYAVGTILYEILTGELPFDGRNHIDLLMKKATEDAPSVATLRPEVPEALATVVARCLARRPADRPPSMRALEYELTRAVDGRASAVAAVLGLDVGDGDVAPDDPSASGSMPRASILSVTGAGDPAATESGSHARPPLAPTPAADPRAAGRTIGGAFAAGLKALLFVGLGGVLAVGAIWKLAPESGDKVVEAIKGQEAPPPDPDAAKAAALPAPEPTPEPTPAPIEAKQQVLPPTPTPVAPPEAAEGVPPDGVVPPPPAPAADTPEAIVARAEAALERKQWLEPPQGSLAMELNQLQLVDPGSDALVRLRSAALDQLRPAAAELADAGKWEEAAASYRAISRIAPDDDAARESLLGALMQVARRQMKRKEYELALGTVKEVLNLGPEDPKSAFPPTLMKADAMYRLGDYDGARDAYDVARKLRPKNRAARKGFYRARSKAKAAKKK